MKWLGCGILTLILLTAGKTLSAQQIAFYQEPVNAFPTESVIAPDWPIGSTSSGTPADISLSSYEVPGECYDGTCAPCDMSTPYGYGQIRPSHPAKWIAGFDVLYMFRVGEQGRGVIYRQTDNAELFSMSDFDFDGQFAYRAYGQYNIAPRWGIEGVYTRLQNDWNSSAIVTDGVVPDVLPIELRAANIAVLSPTEPFVVNYTTEFQSGEINTKYYLNDWSVALIGGFRWVEVDERFSAVVANTVDPFSIDTSNQMFGGQFGVESQHWLGYGVLRLDISLKGGAYTNSSSVQTAQVGIGGASNSSDAIAWLGEAEIGLTMPIFRHGNLRAGYRVIHMAGLAIAADQLNTADLVVPETQINNDGQALYHGVSLGFEYWF